MRLKTHNYNGETIPSIIRSLEADANLTNYLLGQNLPAADVREAIASFMAYDDPETVEVDDHGKVS